MCHFISGIIPRNFDIAELNRIGSVYSILFNPCENDYLIKQLATDEIYLIKKSNPCDCGTELGMYQRLSYPAEFKIEQQELEKLKKKGWNDTKIKRWVAEKNKIYERSKKQLEEFKTQEHSDIMNWLNFFRDLFNNTTIKRFGILLHFYSGAINSEEIEINDKINLKIGELNKDMLLCISEDSTYYITR